MDLGNVRSILEPRSNAVGRRRDLAVAAGACLVLAVLLTLSRGEARTAFHQACLSRFSDAQTDARHRLGGSVDSTHPFAGELARRNHTLNPLIVEALARAGLPFDLAVACQVVLCRTLFGLGLSWLIYAATRRLGLSLLAALMAFSLAPDPMVYGYTASLAISGMATTSLFLCACALRLLGHGRLSVLVWLLQGWMHPITFAVWAPVYIGLWLDERFGSGRRTCMGLAFGLFLLLAPLTCGLLAWAAEAGGWLGLHGDAAYWAVVRTRLMHTVFLGTHRYLLPLQYLGALAALAVLGFGRAGRPGPLVLMNRLAALLGLGIFLLYAVCAEGERSALVAALLPLRFESVLYPLLLANVFAVALDEEETAGVRLFSAMFAVPLMLSLFDAFTWSWLWAAAVAWRYRAARAWGPLPGWLLLAGGAATACAYALLAPDETGSLTHRAMHAVALVQGLLLLALLGAVGLRAAQFDGRATLAVLATGVALLVHGTWPAERLGVLKDEVMALARGAPEQSPQRSAVQWLEAHVPPDVTVLTHPDLLLHMVTPLRVSANDHLLSLLPYLPDQAADLLTEIESIYAIDLPDLARRRAWLPDVMRERWPAARRRAMAGDADAYVAEAAAIPADGGGRVLFENAFLRLYGPAALSAAPTESQPGALR